MAVLLAGPELVDEGADCGYFDVVNVPEVIAHVELVELEGHDEGREVGGLPWFRADEGDDMVGAG